ncbi:MAG: single-stranded DNA-binding protein [Acidimicrobiales bacterium]
MATNGVNVTIVGNVTRDPELRFTNSGMAVANFGVAVNFRRMNRQTNDWEEEEPTFYDVSCFQQFAENVAESLSKGTRVVVTGRLRQRSWEGNDGEKRTRLEVLADEVGPSLRWATAEVQRSERRSGDDFGGGGGGAGRGGGSRSGGGGGGGAGDYDEEPF